MQMVRLIYVSTMTEACDTDALQSILAESRRKNNVAGITGALCYDPRFFLQWLEGPRETVNELYTTIARDPRHKDVVLLEYDDVAERVFGEWSMAFISTSMLDKATLDKYSFSVKFSPYNLGAEMARAFMLDILELKREMLTRQH